MRSMRSMMLVMPNDTLLLGASRTGRYQELLAWYDELLVAEKIHRFIPDYHRLQMEHWLYERYDAGELAGDVLDIGAQSPRRWIGAGYKTFGNTEDADSDVVGDLMNLTAFVQPASKDAIICTEVLEHCKEPSTAMRKMFYALKPGGWLYVTSPFLWPWHGTQDYEDYWRFTHEGWRLLLANEGFEKIAITGCAMTDEGIEAYHMMRRWEAMGFAALTGATTGYLCSARRPMEVTT